eukprot:TRINITY_DN2511_c0_g1_i3.p1 TRINITY_DN2511_c0_g1~~TRINITY_DN2511_c0_g1_i3.p1  ORF type:complete len:1593 (-),score=567.73 TRINITY_DN2511_c0_g1_i3:64-4842(-)
MASQEPLAMEVDQTGKEPSVEDDAAAGLRLYRHLLQELMQQLHLQSSPGTLKLESQLLAYHHAARLFDVREQVLALLRGESGGEELPAAYRAAALAAKDKLTDAGTWPRPSALKGKRVFGHKSAVKFLQLPNLPDATHGASIFLPEKPVVEGQPGQNKSFTFTKGAYLDPLAELEAKQSALVLPLDAIMKGAVVVINPALKDAASLASPEEKALASEVSALIARQPDAWRRLIKLEQDLFSLPTAQLIRQVLKMPSSSSTVTPQKPGRQSAATKSAAQGEGEELESPEKNVSQAASVSKLEGEDACHKAYQTLLAAMFNEMDFFAEQFQGLDWLDIKKQLLVYRHAAQMNEERDGILAVLRGDSEQLKSSVSAPYKKAVESVRSELLDMLASEGQKAKKIFGHDHVIRYHTVKGLPVPRTSCIFLRERPQSSSDILRKTPSIFRDLVRFRCTGSPLMDMEHHGLAVVLTVQEKAPRAFLVVSPLFEKPELIEDVVDKSWSEIHTALKEHLTTLIMRESDAWRAFIQRHADIVSKDSLKIIQKVLKNCVPGSGAGAYTQSCFVEDVEEAVQLRESANMAREEALIRWGMAQEAAEVRWLDAETRAKAAEATASRAKHRLQEKEKKAAESWENKFEQLKDGHRQEVAQLSKARDEVQTALEMKGVELLVKAEEITGLTDMQQEMLQAMNKMDRLTRAERAAIKTKNHVLKQQLKQCQKAHADKIQEKLKEQNHQWQESFKEAEAKFSAVQKATIEEQSKLVKEADEKIASVQKKLEQAVSGATAAAAEHEVALEKAAADAAAAVAEHEKRTADAEAQAAAAKQAAADARAAETKALAELEVKVAAFQTLSDSNVTLRTELTHAKEAAETARSQALESSEAELRALSDLETVAIDMEVAVAKSAELEAAVAQSQKQKELAEQELEAAKAKTAEADKALRTTRAELQAVRDEAARLSDSCAKISADAARLPQLREQKASLEEQLREQKAKFEEQLAKASGDASAATTRADALESSLKDLKLQLVQVQAELSNKAVTLSQAQDSNKNLRIEVAEAKDQEAEAVAQIAAAERKVADEKAATEKVEADLRIKIGELEVVQKSCKSLEAKAEEESKKAADARTVADKAEEKADERVAAAEQDKAVAQKAERLAQAELKAMTEEIARLTESCVSLTGAAARAKEEAAQAAERADSAEKISAESKHETVQKQAELEVAKASLATIQASNTTLRAELAGALMEGEEARKRSEKAEKASEKAEKVAEKAEKEAAKAQEEAAAAEAKASKYEKECKKLRESRKEEVAKVDKAQKLAEAAQKAIDLAQSEERKAKMRLTVQAEESQKLTDTCAKLHAEAAKALARAEAAEQRAAVAEAERKVALAASEMTEEDVRRMALKGVAPAAVDAASPVKKQVDKLTAELEAALQSPEPPVREADEHTSGPQDDLALEAALEEALNQPAAEAEPASDIQGTEASTGTTDESPQAAPSIAKSSSMTQNAGQSKDPAPKRRRLASPAVKGATSSMKRLMASGKKGASPKKKTSSPKKKAVTSASSSTSKHLALAKIALRRVRSKRSVAVPTKRRIRGKRSVPTLMAASSATSGA